MTIDDNFFQEVHSFFKDLSRKYIIPHIGKLNESDISDKPDNSKVTKYDLIVEEELITFFNRRGFQNIISEEHSSDLLDYNEYMTIDPIDGTRNFINGINKVVMMVSYINHNNSIFSIIRDVVSSLGLIITSMPKSLAKEENDSLLTTEKTDLVPLFLAIIDKIVLI